MNRTFPLFLHHQEARGDSLATWLASKPERLQHALADHGGLVFRGFEVVTPDDFQAVAEQCCDQLVADNGEHDRDSLTGSVYTPVRYRASEKLLWHNENTFNHFWPSRILFACAQPAKVGGETPIVDCRALYRRLDAGIRAKFEQHGVMYVRRYTPGLGRSWQDIFNAQTRAEAETFLARNRMTAKWRGDLLETHAVRPAVWHHPQTGMATWVNQAQHWHPSCLSEYLREALADVVPPDQFPRDCRYGDGSRIEDAVMAEILAVYAELEQSFAWEPGDVMVLDNTAVAHGRNPYRGKRKLYVAIGDLVAFPT
ncbi:TauD/TfdA family dioxygenase [Acanthopleuribacter pedis]|uniref:TauD/TfdA family dioxygenase n=1 Tax=Acanthopleuribacter pedis TaxID=442870 RepID=A0A8J7QEH1_9BACT|nr:TauD/TfdA family dioxygenase [Acanthopleuribacter pedis]MBO1323127.1 TauD/TfdA family dioxygenase [Acanthopleuribacter pedis]